MPRNLEVEERKYYGFTKVNEAISITEKKDISLVGRIFKDDFGNYTLSDEGINIRLEAEEMPKLNLGDFVVVHGDFNPGTTPYLSIRDVEVLSGCVNPIYSNTDLSNLGSVETVVNNEKRETILLRAKALREIRAFLDDRNFVELETPILRYYPGTSSTNVFTTISGINNHQYSLRSSPERQLIRMGLGFNRFYEIGKCFRKGEADQTHSPEFTMIEYYSTFTDYRDIMDLTEEMTESVAIKIKGTTKLPFGDHLIDVKRPWERISIREAGIKFYGFDPINTSTEELKEFLQIKGEISRSELLTLFIENKLEKLFIQPTFLTNFPIGVGAPEKTNVNDKLTMERAEVFIAEGLEFANIGSANNDPELLRKHYEKHITLKFGKENLERYLDREFLYEMGCGMPPLAGGGIGIDRLVMLLANETNINKTMCYSFK